MLDTRSLAKQFDDANGEYIVCGGWVYFKNGAAREAHPMGRLIELGDINKYKRLQNQYAYYEAWLQRVVDRFNTIKEEYESYANAVALQGFEPDSPDDTIRRMKSLKKAAKKYQDILADLEQQMEQTPQGRAVANAEQRRAESQASANQERAKALKQIRKLRI